MRRKSKKIMKSRILIIAMVLSVFLSLTSVAMDSVYPYESVNIEKTANEIEELESNIRENADTSLEEKTESSTNEDEENVNTLENEDSSTNEETVIDKDIIVDEEGNIVEEEVFQPDVDEELLAFSTTMFSNYGETHYIDDVDGLVAFLNGHGNFNDEFILTGDIDMSGRGPFRGRWGEEAFTGRFASEEGKQFKISNLRLTGRDTGVLAEAFGGNDVGFIRTVGNGAIIENVSFENASYAESPGFGALWQASEAHIGLVVGRIDGGTVKLHNINVDKSRMTIGSSTVQNGLARVGSLIGSVGESANVSIEKVSIGAEIQMFNVPSAITWDNQGGGLVGVSAGNLTIVNSQVNVDITRNGATGNFVGAGGVLGRRAGGNVTIKDVVQNGDVQANVRAGGIVGSSEGDGTLILDRVSTSEGKTITTNPAAANNNDNRLGGLVGSAVGSTTITNSNNNSAISLTTSQNSDVGGLVGFSSGGITINTSNNYGNLSQSGGLNDTRMAGIVARTENNVTLTNVKNWGHITRTHHPDTTETEVYPNGGNNRLSSGILSLADVAAGEVVNVDNAVNHGDMLTHIRLSAGIVGRLIGEGNVNITNSINHGDINTWERAGGIVGRNEVKNLIIDGCINYGRLSAENGTTAWNMMGGIISTNQRLINGNRDVLNVTIRNCANRGEIVSRSTADTYYNGTGGIAGWIPNDGLVIENSYNIGHVRSTGNSSALGGIIGKLQYLREDVKLTNVYSIGPVTTNVASPSSGNGILGRHRQHTIANQTVGLLVLNNVYVSTFFSRNAITDMPGQIGRSGVSRSSNVYVDTSTAPTASTTVPSRLQTEVTEGDRVIVKGVTTEELVSGELAGLQGVPWMYGIAGVPYQRTLPYFAWQVGDEGKQQEQFFHGIHSTNVEAVVDEVNYRLRGIISFPLTATNHIPNNIIQVRYSTEGYANNENDNVRIFTPNDNGRPHSSLENEVELRDITATVANIPSGQLTTGLISSNDVVGFDARIGHRINFDLNGGEQIDDTPLVQILIRGEAAAIPEVEREGYVFTGWTTEADGGGEHYAPGADIEVLSEGTFYAQWVVATTTLTVGKEVRGTLGNLIQEFEFTIYFYDSDRIPLPEYTEFNYEGITIGNFNNEAPDSGTLILGDNGSATFRLAAGQAIRLLDAPATGYVRIVETPNVLYDKSISITDIDGEVIDTITGNDTGDDTDMLPGARDRTFTFINYRTYVPPTGIEVGNMGLVIILVLVPLSALAAFVFHVILKHRRRARVLKIKNLTKH